MREERWKEKEEMRSTEIPKSFEEAADICPYTLLGRERPTPPTLPSPPQKEQSGVASLPSHSFLDTLVPERGSH